MILRENMQPIEHVVLHEIGVLSQHSNVKLSFEHIEVADEFTTSKNTHLTRFFIIKPGHPGRLKKSRSGWKKPLVGANGVTRGLRHGGQT